MNTTPPIPKHHLQWFNTLKQAFNNGDVALMSCLDAKTKEPLSVICIVQREEGCNGEMGDVVFTPIANLAITDNPYHSYIPHTTT